MSRCAMQRTTNAAYGRAPTASGRDRDPCRAQNELGGEGRLDHRAHQLGVLGEPLLRGGEQAVGVCHCRGTRRAQRQPRETDRLGRVVPAKRGLDRPRDVDQTALGGQVATAEHLLAGRRAEGDRVLSRDHALELLAGHRAQRFGARPHGERAAQERQRPKTRAAVGHVAGVEDPPRRDVGVEGQQIGDLPPRGVEEQVGRLGGDLAEVAEIADAGVGEDQPRAGVGAREVGHALPQPGKAATGVEQHRRAVLVGERHQPLDDRMRQVERVAARMELEPDGAGRERLLGRPHGLLPIVRVDPGQRDQAAVRPAGRVDRRGVGVGVAARLVHREDQCAPMAGAVESGDDLLRRGLAPVGIVLTEVGVGVEELQFCAGDRERVLVELDEAVVVRVAGDGHEEARLPRQAWQNRTMPHGDRLTALDSTFLHLEKGGAHMHVASIFVFEGDAPPYDKARDAIEARMHLVPRYRQRLAEVPYGQGRPVWVDDPHFNIGYHVRHTALPAPGSDDVLKRLAGRLFAQPLDRSKPLWEIWVVEGLEPVGGTARWAMLCKTHHALVDGISGVDITAVLLDAAPEAAPPAPPERPWEPGPTPGRAQLLADALLERATQPREIARGVRAMGRGPRQVLNRLVEAAVGLGAMAWAGLNPAPPSPFNVPIGPHRRYTWVDADLAEFKTIKDALGGTINDVVLTAVTLALGRYLRRNGYDTRDLVLKAMVPVSVRADAQRGALGNRVSNVYAPLPVGLEDPAECFAAVHTAMGDLKGSGQAVGAQVITRLGDFAPPTIMTQAARLQARQRFFNLVVTNVPGPQIPLYVLGRRMTALYPVVPLAQRQALGIAIMSYDGSLGFGLLADYDAVPDVEELAEDLRTALADLARAAAPKRARAARGNGAKPARRGTPAPSPR